MLCTEPVDLRKWLLTFVRAASSPSLVLQSQIRSSAGNIILLQGAIVPTPKEQDIVRRGYGGASRPSIKTR